MKSVRQRRSQRTEAARGQALVEFALVAPLFFLLLVGIFEAGRFVLFQQTLNNATREGARYAIVHGANSNCPSGPWPAEGWGSAPSQSYCDGGWVSGYDTNGQRIMDRVQDAAVGLLGIGTLKVGAPVWTQPLDWSVPARDVLDELGEGGNGNGDNARGSHVTVFADFSYDTIFEMVLGTDLLPEIEIRTESTLVINN